MLTAVLLLFAAPAPAPYEPIPQPPDLEPAAIHLLTTDDAVPAASAELRDAVRRVALRWEILDGREVRYILTREEDFLADVKLLRRRYADLKDAPSLYWCMAFPDRNLINDILAFNRAYKTHLEGRLIDLPNAWTMAQVILETDELFKVWDLARDTRCDYYYMTVRRQTLNKLKELIGDQAFYSGQLPPHVPVWRFARLDP